MSEFYEPRAGISRPTRGLPTLIWQGEVATVNRDGTVDVRSRKTRAGKSHVPVMGGYQPRVGDRVVVTNLDGDPQSPFVLGLVAGRSSASGGIPVGVILATGADAPDEGFLMCDGMAHSRETYSELFAKIGTKFGAGNESTTFNVPNGEDCFLLGAGAIAAVGGTGGVSSVTLTVDQIPSHAHYHTGAQSSNADNGDPGSLIVSANTEANGNHPNQGWTSNAGGGQSHTNMPPYVGVNFMIKAL